MSNQSKGPWTPEKSGIYAADGLCVAMRHPQAGKEWADNAHLIAFAPEMFQLVEALADLMEQPEDWPDDTFECFVPIDAIRKAHSILTALG